MNQEERTQKLERLLNDTFEMRRYQVLWFKNKLQGDLRLAKQLEKVVDVDIAGLRDVHPAEPIQQALL